ncbi:MAG: universal stress protein [Anaerolineales bacterium]|nr:universal stress protein [Anaerolineales bacterium]
MRVLVATGGSHHSDVAVRFAAQLASAPADELMIMYVRKGAADNSQPLTQAQELARGWAPRVEIMERRGHPAEEILREAEVGDYDVVVLGERQHHSLMTRFLLGSTAERVVEHAPVPVIIAKGEVQAAHRVLLCDSGVQSPSLLSRFSGQIPDLIGRGQVVTILHVMSQISAGPGVRGHQLRANAEELIAAHTPEGEILERDKEVLAGYNIVPQIKVRHGRVVEEILAEAREGAYDLIVIGSHAGEGWRRILLDDLAHQIITQVDRPVLVVR